MAGVVRARDSWWVPIDPWDVSQERALAVLERRCPDAAAKAWFQKERLWYRYHLSFRDNVDDPDFVDAWIFAFHAATPQDLAVSRSDESVEQRREYVRNWWKQHGREYRRKRQSEGRAGRNERPRPGADARTH